MEDSFKEDSFVEEKKGGDSFVEDSFEADVPEKKNSAPLPLKSDSGISESMGEVLGYEARSIGKIKQNNAKAVDFEKSNILKQQMAKDLSTNKSPAYRKKYIETLSAKGYDADALQQFANSLGQTSESNEATNQMIDDGSGVLQDAPTQDNTPLLLKPGKYASDLLDKLSVNAEAGMVHGATKMYEGAEQIEQAKRSGKDWDEIAKEEFKGTLKALSGAGEAGFAGAGAVVPTLMAFNAGIETAKSLPKEAKSQIVSQLYPAAKPNELEKNAERFDKTLELPFTLVSTSAKALGYEPEPGTWQADAMELADLATVLFGPKAAVKIKGKVIDTVKGYQEAQKLAMDGQLTDLEMKDFRELTESLQGVTPENLREAAIKYAEEQPVKNDVEQTKLAELEASVESPEFQKLPLQTQETILRDIENTRNEIKVKEGDELMNESLEAQEQGQIADLDEQINIATELLEGQPPSVKASIENSINDLIKQRDAIQKQRAENVLQREQGAAGETGSERAGVEPIIEGAEATEKTEVQKAKEEITLPKKSKKEAIDKLRENKSDKALHTNISNYKNEYHVDIFDNQKSVVSKSFKTHDEAIAFVDKFNKENAENNKVNYDYGTYMDVSQLDAHKFEVYSKDENIKKALQEKMGISEIKSEETPAVEAETIIPEEKTEPVVEAEAVVEAPKETGISDEMLAKQRKELGLPELPPRDKNISDHTWDALNKEANRLLESKEVDYNKLAEDITDGTAFPSDLNNVILNRGVVEIGNKMIESRNKSAKAKGDGDLAATDLAAQEYMQAIADLAKIEEALSVSKEKGGRIVSSFKTSMQEDFSPGALYRGYKEKAGGKDLPPELVDRIGEHAAKIEDLNARLKAAEELSEMQSKQIEGLKKKQPSAEKEKIKEIRKKRSDLFDEWKKYREERDKPSDSTGGGTLQMSLIPIKVGESSKTLLSGKDFEFLGKVIASYLEEGVVTTVDVSKRLKTDVKEMLGIKISDEDVYNILNAEVNGKKPIDDFEYNGLIGDIAKTKERLETLRNDLKNPDEYLKRIQKAKEARDKKQDFKSDELKAIEAEIQEVLQGLRIEREKVKKQIRNEQSAIEYAARSKSEKIKEGVANVLNVPRSLMASFDFSAPLRQGLVASVAHPTIAAKAVPEMFKQAFSQKRFEEWMIKYKMSPEWELAKKSELYIADASEFSLNGKEEAFMSNLAEKIPVIGKGIKISERAYVGYLNKLRSDVFNQGAELLMDQGMTFEKNKREFKALADFINSSTGRGKLPNKTIEDAAPLLNATFFSPRLIASRVNLLNPVYYAKMPPAVRAMAIKDMAKFTAFAGTILALAKAGGAEVETDPRSSDFAKIKVGDTRYDVLGGFQQYIKLAAEMITGEKKKGGQTLDLTKPNWENQSRGTELLKFARQKLSPAVAMGVDFLTGKTTTGEDVNYSKIGWDNEFITHLTPLQLQQAAESYKAGGIPKVIATMIPSMFGIGVQTYSNAKKNKTLQKEFKAFMKDAKK